MAGQLEQARATYRRTLALLDRSTERDVWTCATGFATAPTIGDAERMDAYLAAPNAFSPTPEQVESIARGIEQVVKALGSGGEAVSRVRRTLERKVVEP